MGTGALMRGPTGEQGQAAVLMLGLLAALVAGVLMLRYQWEAWH